MPNKNDKVIQAVEIVAGAGLAGGAGLYLYQLPVSLTLKGYVNGQEVKDGDTFPYGTPIAITVALKNIFGVEIKPIPSMFNISIPWSYTNQTINLYNGTNLIQTATTGPSASTTINITLTETNYSFVAELNGIKSNTLNINVFKGFPTPDINENISTSNKKILNSYM